MIGNLLSMAKRKRDEELEELLKIHNEQVLEKEIEILVSGGYNYIEAVCEFCETKDVDYSHIKKILSPTILAKIKDDAISLNFIKGKKSHKLI